MYKCMYEVYIFYTLFSTLGSNTRNQRLAVLLSYIRMSKFLTRHRLPTKPLSSNKGPCLFMKNAYMEFTLFSSMLDEIIFCKVVNSKNTGLWLMGSWIVRMCKIFVQNCHIKSPGSIDAWPKGILVRHQSCYVNICGGHADETQKINQLPTLCFTLGYSHFCRKRDFLRPPRLDKCLKNHGQIYWKINEVVTDKTCMMQGLSVLRFTVGRRF